ncbi:hypothetical protein CKO42_09835 [Lamprobacter modestohalophilus]|uniref:Uncharacterized protein n=1 Tax=Lamprobacter modestohalophilus TaxID=1064514 RepID=A0A9X0W865_9GAMM|nr:hypothetical protein [Lamprobacter modestohalophilus]MBK1618729.1 hypothetical protein [Lamprobacter modestohalophilus]
MQSIAYQVHRTRERMRLRLPDRRHDEAFFAELCEQLTALPGIVEVSGNPSTAGLLIRLDPTQAQDPRLAIAATGRLQIVDGPPPLSPGLNAVRRAADRIDRSLEEQTGGSADLRTLAVLLLIVLAMGQVLRGQLLAPAASLLWYAFELLRFIPTIPEEPEPRQRPAAQHLP